MNRLGLILVVGVVCGLVGLCLADWPQFQGPNRDGVSTETVKLADAWPADGPKLLWKNAKLGKGYGGAVVEGGKIYIMDRVADKQDVLRCLTLATGEEEWNFAYDAVGADGKGTYKGNYNGSRNHPAVDDKNVYVIGPFGHVNAVSKETHKSIWSANLVADYDATISNWGFCQNPTLYKNTMIVAPLSKKAGIVALDKATGKEVWKTDKLGDIAWTSPMAVTIEGVDVIAMLHTRDKPRFSCLDAATGKELVRYSNWKCPNPIASQIYCGDGKFFITGGYGAGCAMVQVKKGDPWKAEELFVNKDCGSWAVNAILFKGNIYANSNDVDKATKKGNGLMCMDLAGKVVWTTGNEDVEDVGGITIADGKLFRFFSNKNIMTMAAASPDGYKELGRFEVGAGTNNWAPIVVTDGKLLLRIRDTMYCYDVSAGK